MSIKLRPYQNECTQEIQKNHDEGITRQLVSLPTGTGKTLTFAELARQRDCKTLIVAHREELLKQAREKTLLIWPNANVGFCRAEENDIDRQITIASVQSAFRNKRLDMLRKQNYELCIVDECFPVGTLVDGKPIEKYKIGDIVNSFNHITGEIETKRVLHVFKNKCPQRLMKVKFESNEIICTENHPIFVEGTGYIEAKNIKEGQYAKEFKMHPMQQRNDMGESQKKSKRQLQEKGKSILFSGMFKNLFSHNKFKNHEHNQQEICFRTNEEKQSNGKPRDERKGRQISESYGTQTSGEKGQRNGIDNTARNNDKGSENIKPYSGISNSNKNSKRKWLPNMLQGGCRTAGISDCNRAGREQPQSLKEKRRGQNQRCAFNLTRVDSIEVLERTGDGTFRELCPDGYVYNLEVEDNNNYFANGILVHNCHHAAADSYEKVIEGLGFMDDDPDRLLVGFTATAARGDGVKLGKIFQKITYEKSIVDMIKAGYLVDLKGIRIKTGIDLSGVKKSHGDYVDSQLSAVVNTTNRNQLIVKSYQEHTPEMKAIAFCVDVQHSKDLAEEFNKAGIAAKAAYGSMGDDERAEIVRELAAGEIRVVTNCQLFTEGFDEPSIQAVLMCRPTRSNTFYTQCVGRGTRLFPGKNECIILDFTDMDNKLCTLGTLLGSDKPLKNGETILDAVHEDERDRDEYGMTAASGNIYAEHMDLFDRSAFVWTAIPGGHFKLPSGINEYVFLRNMGTGYKTCVVKDNQVITSLNDMPLSLEYAQGIAEDFIRNNNAVRFADKSAAWRNYPATEKQINTLRKLGIKVTPVLTRGEASQLLDSEFGNRTAWKYEQPSSKQIYALKRFGKYQDGITRGEAHAILTQCM